MNSYKTVKSLASDELTEKRSRFIGYCKPVKSEAEAIEFINKIKKEHWDARHNVYAYSLPEAEFDDEKRVLEVLTKSGVVDAVIVVTRYFGGILLGTGGLVRAYSAAAKLGMTAAEVVTMELCSECEVECSYTQYGKLNTLIIECGGFLDDTAFADNVRLCFHIPTDLIPALDKKLADATGGSVKSSTTGEKYLAVKE